MHEEEIDVKLGFVVADGPKGEWYSKLIAWWTNGPFSHVELIYKDKGKWIKCSSREITKSAGCVEHNIHEPGWVYVDLAIKKTEFSIIKEFFKEISGAKYDIAGIFGFILPTKDRSDRWFCSEAVSNALKIASFRPMWNYDPSNISPNFLFELLLRDYSSNKKSSKCYVTNINKDDIYLFYRKRRKKWNFLKLFTIK